MLATILQKIVDEKLTTVKQIAELTGRGESTVYRWLSRSSQPNFHDIRLLVRHLANPKAKMRLVELFAADLPLKLEWMNQTEDSRLHEAHKPHYDSLDIALLALESLTQVINKQRSMYRRQHIDDQNVSQTVHMIDDTIRHLTASKHRLLASIPRRKHAR